MALALMQALVKLLPRTVRMLVPKLVLELAEAALSAGDPPLGPEARQNRAAWLKAADRPLSPDVRAAAEDLWDACRAYFLCCFAVALTCPPHPARRLVAQPLGRLQRPARRLRRGRASVTPST